MARKQSTENLEVVYGFHPVEEALAGGRRVKQLLLRSGEKGRRDLIGMAEAAGVKVRMVSPAELDRLAQQGNHQGVAALLAPFEYADFDDLLRRLEKKEDALVVLLDSVKDAGNLGAVLRSACAAGADGVIIPQDRAAPVNAGAIRVSAGAAERIPVVRVVNLVRAMQTLRDAGFWVAGTAGEGDGVVWDVDLKGKIAWVFGDEEKGLRRLVRETCDGLYRIPMPGRFESLNLSAAAAVCLFETVRQRR